MAILVVVAVKDLAAQAFGRPFFVPSVGVATRSFADEVNRRADDNQMATHPADFELYEVGEFDDSNGMFTFGDRFPRLLTRAVDVVVSGA